MLELSREQLQKELDAAQAELEEVEEMRDAILGQTGVHLGVRKVGDYHTRFDHDHRRLTERIAELRKQLDAV